MVGLLRLLVLTGYSIMDSTAQRHHDGKICVEVTVGGQSHQTTLQNAANMPTWNEEMRFAIPVCLCCVVLCCRVCCVVM